MSRNVVDSGALELVRAGLITYRQLNERTNQTANALLALDFSPGDRIACLMSNQSQYAEAFYACAKAGFVFVAPNPAFARPDRSGAFTLSGLPHGDYRLQVWHPRFGRATREVTVPRRGGVRVALRL